MLKLTNLSVTAGNKQILHKINFEFEQDKVYAVMGPNGSGKSTLGYSIAGHPAYEVVNGSIVFNNEDITEEEPEKRAEKGIFLSFQSPLQISGVTVFQLLRLALEGKVDPLELKQRIERIAKELKIRDELLSRSLNEGASGGERKKLELLQAVVLDPKFLIFDEIDTGVDVDALKIIGQYIDKIKSGRSIVLITHYNRILKYINPDYVLVLANGRLVKVGERQLAHQIEEQGYESLDIKV
ncbi:MAG: ABC transporter ATP-binding protein [Patescibacteria group bacterium]|nr:MAG: ABC transporter ATP-binding protein [Patescibacteria group bacterium]